jgi:hypothetical protein
MKQTRVPNQFLHKHSLSLAALGVVVLLIVLYSRSNPSTHWGSFFGNAIADWSGVLVTVVMTKHLYEKGSAESKKPKGKERSAATAFMREHSLTIFLLMTGLAWLWRSKRWTRTVGGDKSSATSFRSGRRFLDWS